MSHLEALLAAESFAAARGVRSATVRHRRLLARPLAVVTWQLGGEPFSVAAIGFGRSPASMRMTVAGEPRNRDLAFRALLPFARWFNDRFEALYHGPFETVPHRAWTETFPAQAPQVVVCNEATVEHLRRLGRRLAYLSPEGEFAADPALIRLGAHLQFVAAHATVPGQQLLISLTDLVGSHWATPQSEFERRSLLALDAFLDPSGGLDGFAAAARAEREPIGPVPEGDEDQQLWPLVERFNERRGRRTDTRTIRRPLIAPIEAHYRPLVERAWELLWRCHGRELALPEARSVEGRWREDRRAYGRHLEWVLPGRFRRARDTPYQTARLRRLFEDAERRLQVEEAYDDPLRMLPHVLSGEAVIGEVTEIDADHREIVKVNYSRRPLVRLALDERSPVGVGDKLHWAEDSHRASYRVDSVSTDELELVLKREDQQTAPLPRVGQRACFTALSPRGGPPLRLSSTPPWTHVPSAGVAGPQPIEEKQE